MPDNLADEMSEQERYRQEILEKFGRKNKPQELAPKPQADEGQEVESFSGDELEQSDKDDLNELIDQTANELGEPVSGADTVEIPNLNPESMDIQDSFLTKMMNEKTKQALAQMISDNPFSKMSEGELKSFLRSRFEGNALGRTMEKNPRAFSAFVDVLRDKKALPSLLGIVNKPKKVKLFSYIALGIFIAIFIFNLMNSKKGLLRRIFTKLFIGLFGSVCNLTAFYILFKEELTPTVDIVLKHFGI